MRETNVKTKICFISFLAYPLFNHKVNAVFGGAEIDLYNLARKLSKKDKYQVSFIVGDYGQDLEEIHENIKVRKFKYFNLQVFKKIRHKILRQWVMWKELFTLDADIYVTEASSELLGWLTIISGKIRDKKVIFRLAHDLDTDFADTRQKGLKLYLLYKYGINHSDYLISQTQRQKTLLKNNLGLESSIMKNGFFINENIDFGKKKYILWVARAEEWKRPDLFIEMAKKLPQENFVMIMPGNNTTKNRIKEKAIKLSNVNFIDFVPFVDVQKYYDEAKLFVNTSEYEGFPNAFVQACLGKTPILSFNVNPDDFINKNRLGHVCNDDLEDAVRFIQRLNHENIRELGENALRYVKENHNIDTIAEEFEHVLASVHGDSNTVEGEKCHGLECS